MTRISLYYWTTLLFIGAIFEAGFASALSRTFPPPHITLIALIIGRASLPVKWRLMLAAFNGAIIDLYTHGALGEWFIGLPIAILITDIVFTRWLSHRSWLAAPSLAALGWTIVHLCGIAFKIGTPILSESFSSYSLLRLSADLVETVALTVLILALLGIQARRFHHIGNSFHAPT